MDLGDTQDDESPCGTFVDRVAGSNVILFSKSLTYGGTPALSACLLAPHRVSPMLGTHHGSCVG
jgi:hypothetical protein